MPATGCAIHPSGSFVVTTGADCTAVVWGGLAAGTPERITMTRVSRPLTCVACVDVERVHVIVCGGEAGTYLFTYRPQSGAIDI
jgi:hypothetical protein